MTTSDFDYVLSHNLFDSNFEFDYYNVSEHRTLRELVAPDVNYKALCIAYPEVVAPFELKFGLIHLFPRFTGLAGENPHKHLT